MSQKINNKTRAYTLPASEQSATNDSKFCLWKEKSANFKTGCAAVGEPVSRLAGRWATKGEVASPYYSAVLYILDFYGLPSLGHAVAHQLSSTPRQGDLSPPYGNPRRLAAPILRYNRQHPS